MRTRLNSKAFTLVELLIALSIIALLTALLFPVFQKARNNAAQTTCLSNLRQLGTAISLYSTDYDGSIPYACNEETREAVQGGLNIYGSPIDAWIVTAPSIVTTLYPYGVTPLLFRCPLDRLMDDSADTIRKLSWYEQYGSSYAYDEVHGLMGWGSQSYPAPAENLLLFDEDWFHRGSSYEDGLLGALFADMHVKTITWQQRTAALEANP